MLLKIQCTSSPRGKRLRIVEEKTNSLWSKLFLGERRLPNDAEMDPLKSQIKEK